MIVLVLFSLTVAVIGAFIGWIRSKIPVESDIYAPFTDTLDWSRLSASTSMGDDIGDQFLEEVGQASIYSSDSVLTLAASSGPAGLRFLAQFRAIPPWVDMDLVEQGAVFLRRWIDVFGACGVGTIIESYGYSIGANILLETGRLSCAQDATKRLLETGIFNLDIIEYGLDGTKSSVGQEAVARVRMLHCMVRKHVRQSCPWWNVESMGVPVSQEDGAHTIFLNSLSSIRAMEMQGLPITREEKNGVSMFWSYCGHLMGISESFLPKSYHEECQLYHTIFNRSFHPNAATDKLTSATIAGLVGVPPYNFASASICALARMSLGSELSKRLNVPDTVRWRDRLLVQLIRISVILRWCLYTYLNIHWSNMAMLRYTVDAGMQAKGYKLPKYRFSVSPSRNESAETIRTSISNNQ